MRLLAFGFESHPCRKCTLSWRKKSTCGGYFHWTLADNFEWNEGWHLRFGLYELDPATQVRRPRASAQVYERMIKQSILQTVTPGPCSAGTPGSTENGFHHALKEIDAPSRTIMTENEGAFDK